MKSDYVPKEHIEIAVIILNRLYKEVKQRHADIDEIYNVCPVEEKAEFARKRSYLYGYMRDLLAARYALHSYCDNFYGDENGER